MGDTLRVNFIDTEYQSIKGLIEGTTYWLQNAGDSQLMLLQQENQPDVEDIGKRVNSCQDAEIIKETNDIWIKSVIGFGTATYNSVPDAT